MFTPTRDEGRRFLVDAWRRHRAGEPLEGLAVTAAQVVAMHPEYHALLEAPDGSLGREYLPERGDVNPFLHLSLHLALAEQLAIDQPPGIRAHYARLTASRHDPHAAAHAIIECLAEVIWQAQHGAPAPDGSLYLDCVARSR